MKVNLPKFKNTKKNVKKYSKRTDITVLVATLVFVVGLTTFSFYNFETKKQVATGVKGASIGNAIYAPRGSNFVSTNEENNSIQTYTYSTTLSKDQIGAFYDNLANLNGWQKISDTKYGCGSDGNFEYSVKASEAKGHLVTYTYCANN